MSEQLNNEAVAKADLTAESAKTESTKTETANPDPPENSHSDIYDEYRRELTVKQNSNSDNYDKSILTLSSAGLGLSLAFIKDVVPLASVQDRWLLLTSWGFFATAIVVTLASFQCSLKAIQRALDDAEKYYLKGIKEYQTKNNPWNTATSVLNIGSGITFVAAVLATAAFVFTNLPAIKNEPAAKPPINQPTAAPAERPTPASQPEHRASDQSTPSAQPTTKKVTP